MRKIMVLLFILATLWLGVSLVQAQGQDVLVLEIEGPVTPAMAA